MLVATLTNSEQNTSISKDAILRTYFLSNILMDSETGIKSQHLPQNSKVSIESDALL
jgi:hypothetical protein